MSKNDSENTLSNVVVIKPRQEFEVVSDSERTVEEIFYSNPHTDTYAVLVRDDPQKIEFPNRNVYNVIKNGLLVSKIRLTGLPPDGRYFLMNRYGNLLSSTLDTETGEVVFDINRRKKGGQLDQRILSESTLGNCWNENRKGLLSEKKYLSCGSNFDDIQIRTPHPLKKECTILLEGMIEEDRAGYTHTDEWKAGTVEYKLLPREIDVGIGFGPSHQVLPNINSNIKDLVFTHESEFTMHLRIDDKLYGPFKSEEYVDYYRLKFMFKDYDIKGTTIWDNGVNKTSDLSKDMTNNTLNAPKFKIWISADVDSLNVSVCYYSIRHMDGRNTYILSNNTPPHV